jgi:hypothetical protein
MGFDGQLEKLSITPYTDDTFSTPGTSVSVPINPHKYTHTYQVLYNHPEAQGASGGSPKFKRIPSEVVEFELIFDGTGVVPPGGPGADGITAEVMAFRDLVFAFDGQIHRPRWLVLSWGALVFHCTLQSLVITYTLFKPDGTPLRARLATKFLGYTNELELARRANASSPDLSHLVTVRAGDSLPALCHRIYGSIVHYPKVAAINGLTDFMTLEVGSTLLFPPLRSAGT